MKWIIAISFTILCCAAQNEEPDLITVVTLPPPVATDDANNTDTSRIIGGQATTIQNFPYTVQVQYNNRLACGGSLLTRRHVLSAAHCFFDANGNFVSPSRYTVRVGTANLQSGGSVHRVSAVIVHERYNVPLRDNDVAVMVLTSRVSLGRRVALARIPRQGDELVDNSVVVHVGWGRTNPNINQAASVLQQVTIRTIAFSICQARYNWLSTMGPDQYVVTTNMICSGLLDVGGADACQGDSGGPLVYQDIVVGVTSWGYGCADPMFPGVNAKVSAYTNWINQTVTFYSAGPPGSSTNIILIAISVVSSLIFASR